MGEYTPKQKFYLIDPDEFVSVEQDVNYNLKKFDGYAQYLLGYKPTDLAVITGNTYLGSGYKWYKSKTNSLWASVAEGGPLYQDSNARVESWSVSGLSYLSGYGDYNSDIDRVGYMLEPSSNHVRFRGRVVLNGGNTALPLNISVKFLNLPSEILPVASKCFTVYGGNATGDFLCGRIFIPAKGGSSSAMEFVCYGSTNPVAVERYLNLSSVNYPLEV